MPTTYTPVSLTASATVGPHLANGVPVVLNAAAGLTVTLPAASGTGNKYEFIVGTTVTSNSAVIKVANASDTMVGACVLLQDGGSTVIAFEAGGTDDTITMNGTTTCGIKGDRIILNDVASNLWHVQMIASGTGTEATPFSATVS